jgi:hypothetical protein
MGSTKREMTVSEAIQAMVHEGPVSAEQLGEEVFGGKSASMVYKMVRADEPTADVPLRKFVPLMKRVNLGRKQPDYRPVQAICRDLGGLFVLTPKAAPSSCDLLEQAASILKECSDVTAKMGQALHPDSPEGRNASPGEALDIRAEIEEAMQSLAQAYELLDPDRLAAERANKARLKAVRLAEKG